MSDPVKDYINNILDEKRPEFGGKRVCPFAARELQTDNLMIAHLNDKSLIDLIEDFKRSNYNSALFIIEQDIPAEDTKRFQSFVNKFLGLGRFFLRNL